MSSRIMQSESAPPAHMGPDHAGRHRVEPVDPVVSPGEVARGMESAIAVDRVPVLRDGRPASGRSSLYHPQYFYNF